MIDAIRDAVINQLQDHPKRLRHVLAVEETAGALALIHQADEKQVRIAAVFHDYMKFASPEEHRALLSEDIIVQYQNAPVMYHALSAAQMLRQMFGISDPVILDAIRYHVFGCPAMTLVGKIVFVADMCEPNRDFIDWKALRQLAEEDLNMAVYETMLIIAAFLERDHLPLHPLQEEAIDYYREVCYGQTQKSD